MKFYTYSPSVEAQVRLKNGKFIDISRDIVSGNIYRTTNAPSQASLTLANKNGKYAQLLNPMDAIVITLVKDRVYQNFAGYIDSAPFYAQWNNTVNIKCSDTLSRLLYWVWDPYLFDSQELYTGSGFNAVNGQGFDSGMAAAATRILVDVAQWDKTKIFVSDIPQEFSAWASSLAKQQTQADTQAIEDKYHAILNQGATSATVNYVGSGDTQSGTGPATAASNHAWTLHKNCSDFGGPGEDSQGLAGSGKALGKSITCKTANKNGPYYFACCAESPNAAYSSASLLPSRLKNIKYGDKLIFKYGGKSCVAMYLDFGPGLSTGRYLDLGWNTAKALGFSGTGDVQWDFVSTTDKLLSSSVTNAKSDTTASIGNSGAGIVAWAHKYLGKSGYTEGASSRFPGVNRGDCSAFVNAAVYAVTGQYIGGKDSWTGSQMDWLKSKKLWVGGSNSWRSAQAGDVVYYSGHVALYEGNGKVISNGGDPIVEHAADYRPVLGIGRTSSLAANGGGATTSSSSSSATISSPSSTASPLAQAFWMQYILPISTGPNIDKATLFKGEKSLMANEPVWNKIKELFNASMRSVMSAPDGSLVAFFPDKFGIYNRTPYLIIGDIELKNLTINFDHTSLATDVFVAGSRNLGEGVSIESWMDKTAGVVSVNMAGLIDGIMEIPKGSTDYTGQAIWQRYGVRTIVKEMQSVNNESQMPFLYALWIFMEQWTQMYKASADFTFMPELMPGGRVRMNMSDTGEKIEMYCESVTHSFDYTSGFTTSASLSCPISAGAVPLPGTLSLNIPDSGSYSASLTAPTATSKAKGTGTVTIETFGYSFSGAPKSQNFVMNLLTSPYYIDSSGISGLSQSVNGKKDSWVRKAIMGLSKAKSDEKVLEGLPFKDGYKLAIGCSRGHHRSVSLAYTLGPILTSRGFKVKHIDRDINKKY